MEAIFEIPGKVSVEWEPSVRAVLDHWSGLALVTLEEFKDATLRGGLKFAHAHGGHAYIVDNSKAKGAFRQDIQDFIGTDVFPAFAKANIKYFIVVPAADSPLANMSARKYEAKLGPNNLQLVEVPSVAEALNWLREHA